MELLYGKPVAEKILSVTKERIKQSGITPGLAVILVGDDIPSHKYVELKKEAALGLGIYFEKHFFPERASSQDIFDRIEELNHREDIHGIIVQLPLPSGFPTDEIILRIDPLKDTDGFHPETIKQFLAGEKGACPVFPRALMALLNETKQELHGEMGLVITNSELMGQVLSQALRLDGLESNYLFSSVAKEALILEAKKARVIVTACGILKLITGEMVREDAIILDGGMVYINGRVAGDVDRESVETKAAFLSPVPGGVGPVTVATLLARVTDAAMKKV